MLLQKSVTGITCPKAPTEGPLPLADMMPEDQDAYMDQSYLFIVNDPPYGTERAYNAFRLAGSMAKRDGASVRVFLMGDSVGCAMAGQKLPDGYYKLDRMLTSIIRRGGEVACCGTCMDARGITDAMLADGTRRSTLEELTDWTIAAGKTITF